MSITFDKEKFLKRFGELLSLFHEDKSVLQTTNFVEILNDCLSISSDYFKKIYILEMEEVGKGDMEGVKKVLGNEFENISDWRGKTQVYLRDPKVQNYFLKSMMKLYHLFVTLCLNCGKKDFVLEDNSKDNDSFKEGKDRAKKNLLQKK